PLKGRVQVDVLRTQHVFNGTEHVDLAVAGTYNRTLLNIRTDHIGCGAVRIDVVRTILAVIFRDEDQSIGCIRAVRDSLDQAAGSEVVVGLLRFRRIDACKRRAEGSRVVVTDANQRQARQDAVFDVQVELPLPLVIAPQIRIVLVVAAEVDIGVRGQGGLERRDLDDAGCERIGYRRRLRADAADVIYEHPVVANGLSGLQHGIEDIAVLFTERRVGGGVVPVASQQVGRTAWHARRRIAVIGGSGYSGRSVALSDGSPVHRYIAVRSLGLIGQTTVDECVIDLLRN